MLLDRFLDVNSGSQFVEAGAELDGSMQEEFRTHIGELVLLQGSFDASQIA